MVSQNAGQLVVGIGIHQIRFSTKYFTQFLNFLIDSVVFKDAAVQTILFGNVTVAKYCLSIFSNFLKDIATSNFLQWHNHMSCILTRSDYFQNYRLYKIKRKRTIHVCVLPL
eukprot:TCONS_00034796-protein